MKNKQMQKVYIGLHSETYSADKETAIANELNELRVGSEEHGPELIFYKTSDADGSIWDWER